MKKCLLLISMAAASVLSARAQTDTTAVPTMITLDQALQIALSENVSVKVADLEVEKAGYARKGSYASLYPKLDGSASYQRTIKKQVMYMDGGGFDIASMVGPVLAEYLMPLYAKHPDVPFPAASTTQPAGDDDSSSSNEGFSVGRWNTWSAGVSASMPLVNAQLWKTLEISDQDVELAVEKARSSRLETVTQVKQAYFAVLLAKDAFEVYKSVYENALRNLDNIQKKYNAQRASELDLVRAKTNLASAIPDVYNAENTIILALWQLKAVMGVDLDANFDVVGRLSDYKEVLYTLNDPSTLTLDNNSAMRQLAIQAEELANMVKVQEYANYPSLALSFSYAINAMTNDFNFSEFQWSPYSFVGLSLSIPIFNGGKRSSAIKQARVQSVELDLQRTNTERQLKIAIRQYLNTMDTATKSLSSAESAVESAEKAYEIAEKSYNVGRSTLTDLLASEVALTSAKLSVYQAIYSYVVAKANLEQTIGADFISQNNQ